MVGEVRYGYFTIETVREINICWAKVGARASIEKQNQEKAIQSPREIQPP
jgi:hypothetical protein